MMKVFKKQLGATDELIEDRLRIIEERERLRIEAIEREKKRLEDLRREEERKDDIDPTKSNINKVWSAADYKAELERIAEEKKKKEKRERIIKYFTGKIRAHIKEMFNKKLV